MCTQRRLRRFGRADVQNNVTTLLFSSRDLTHRSDNEAPLRPQQPTQFVSKSA
jgi:hypothetical protein